MRLINSKWIEVNYLLNLICIELEIELEMLEVNVIYMS